ncbi:NAD-dependent epimerase/dehydratase family protein [Nocardioides pantholopis]|uniref:NAD-dependent epimerase/dehydratase family protein n=1 Tax=Nocardioides pantholopis TaxID=2483798 RepID=UPI000F080F1C|nr:NAD(P)-dependent oxidoreductase [Nocardioides pantholopis]
MKVLIIGAGFVGSATAARLQELGHEVTVTTTTEAKVEGLTERFGNAVVVRGSDRDAVHAAVAGQDAVVISAGPSAQQSMTPEGRAKTYREILVDTAENVISAPGSPYLVGLSSLSVYGSAANHLDAVDEDSPTTDSDDPSPSSFLLMEQTYLQAADRAAVFRCGDIFGPGDPPIAEKVKMAHQYLHGSVPFAGDALLYRLYVDDAADAVVHAVQQRLTGLFNLTHAEVPPTNATLFDTISAENDLPPLEYRGEIAGPTKPISVQRLIDSGFTPSRSFDPALTKLVTPAS